VEELLDAEPELSRAWSPDGFTALHYAAFFGQEDTAKILVERGADLRVVSTNPEIRVAPLQSAAAGGHDSIVELLLEHGAELDDLESDELRARYADAG
jgi:ankyrin repeat protein